MILKPMLAGTVKNLSEIQYPVLCTPKLDGIRALKIDGKLVSRNFKPIPNVYIRQLIESQFPDGVDGELILTGKSFQETTSAVMTEAGQPQVDYYIFDYVRASVPNGEYSTYCEPLDEPYQKRMENLKLLLNTPPWAIKLLPTQMDNERCLLAYEERILAEGYEGVMLRSPDGPYKEGRSTVKEGYLLKFKRTADIEAKIIGFDERLHNENEAKKDAFGRTERSSHKANLWRTGTLGAFLVKSKEFTNEYRVGTGFTEEQRVNFWRGRDSLKGKIIKVKYQPVGILDVPRFPTFLGFRHPNDMEAK